jgi:Delta7-sterol 5-desaturase
MTIFEKLSWSLEAMIVVTLIHLPWFVVEAWVVWVAACTFFGGRRVSRLVPTDGQVRREILLSLRTLAIFGVVDGGLAFAFVAGLTRIYLRIDQYGWCWFFLSIVAMVLLHDTYFYWTHRAMHHPWLYQRVHRTHHRSVSPTTWSAYAFSSGEALIQAAIVPLVAVTMPVHPIAILVFMSLQIGFNVVGHCGHEIFPRWFMKSPVAALLNSVTHHTLHHESRNGNYSLYLNVWDRLLGTNHAEYAPRFIAVTTAASPPP